MLRIVFIHQVSLLGHSPRNASCFGELWAGSLLLRLGWGRTWRKLWLYPTSSWRVRGRRSAGHSPGHLPSSQLAPEEENKTLGDALRIRSQAISGRKSGTRFHSYLALLWLKPGARGVMCWSPPAWGCCSQSHLAPLPPPYPCPSVPLLFLAVWWLRDLIQLESIPVLR